nr:hypothetical protein [Gammaproteobacteria bacterium]
SPALDQYIIEIASGSEKQALLLARLFRNAFQLFDVSLKYGDESRGSISIGVVLWNTREDKVRSLLAARELAENLHEQPGNEIELIDLRC